MINQLIASNARAGGLFLVLGDVVVFPGLMMFWLRHGERGGAPPSPAYYICERGFVLAAIVLTALGFMLLDAQLQSGHSLPLGRLGATGYMFAGILGVAAEALSLSLGYGHLYPLIVVYVVAAFLSQAAIGGALLQSGVVPRWIGWATILWNVGWLIVLPLITPRDIYFPILHHVAPLLIGGVLLWNLR